MPASSDLESLRHSLAHLLGAAVLELWPGSKLAIGPAIEHGFYYDIDVAGDISDEDLPDIEKKMRQLLKTWKTFEGRRVTTQEARELFATNPFKLELIDEIAGRGDELTLYTSGDFTDLCRGGHVENAKDIDPKAFKLTHLAGAYWRGSEKNPQLTRIYGVAFATEKELKEHLAMLEEAKKRDHRKLGKELELFTIIDEIGPGLPIFYPKGAILRRIVENFITELQEKRGYAPIWIPHITKGELYKISGHLDKFDAMYPPMRLKDEADYYLKPMNCPHFMMLYKSVPHSYRELPVRYTATTTNYRHEKSGELSGLTRVRSLTQDDCHVFCAPAHIEQEINLMLDMIDEVYKIFGFKNFWVRVSKRDPDHKEKYIGDEAIWDETEDMLSRLIANRLWPQNIQEGEAAFYGPKLDFIFEDVLGREWQLSTVQLDMNLPKRFDLEYTDQNGKKQTPIVIHRAILGATERFLGILIEHYAGAFPVWLAPVQVAVLALTDKQNDYAKNVSEKLSAAGVRVELNVENETIGKKIREAELQKVPYILVVGEKEEQADSVAVRQRGKGDMGQKKLDAFIKQLTKEISSKA